MTDRLPRAFFTRSPELVASDLIGCVIACSDRFPVSARIVETEAYGDMTDLASHAAIYYRTRFEIMASEPGTVYVYRSYGIHYCLNIVAHDAGSSGAVLIRAIEPIDGTPVMVLRRGTGSKSEIGRGPGNVATALGIDLEHLGTDVVAGNAISIQARTETSTVNTSPRIGITRDVEREWRFFDPISKSVSKPKRLVI